MEEKIPLFPLKLVPFPGELVNLHIFEPRYKGLINDSLQKDGSFGLPPYINKKIEYGTLMNIVEIVKTYDDGRMDITTKGLKIFRIIDYENPSGGKKYAEGYVDYPDNHTKEDPLMKNIFLEKIEEFFNLINEPGNIPINDDFRSYDVIHQLGLSLEQEYDILILDREIDRQEYVVNYLDKTIPFLVRAKKAKEKIRMNGHFSYFDPINF